MTVYPSYIHTEELPACANWVFMYERTLPNQGGRSLVDNELSDSGAVLAHEIGHQLVRGGLGFRVCRALQQVCWRPGIGLQSLSDLHTTVG